MPRKKNPGTSRRSAPDRERPEIHRPVKAYKNQDFLNSPDARIIRILSEYLEPLRRFRRNRIKDTIVFFGSARARPPVTSQKHRRGQKKKRDLDSYYEDARELAYLLTRWSKGLQGTQRRFTICSGGGPGIMEAANRGASEADGDTIGLNISIKTEQDGNPYISHRLNFEFHYFFVRKFWFIYLAKALVVFPGGFGTMDELFEIMTLIQTEKVTKPIPIILYGSEYWNDVLNIETMIRWGTISPQDKDLLHIMDDPRKTFRFLRNQLEKNYLR